MKNASAEMNTRDVSSVEWEKIAAKKIYFGHQSVGYNIMSGVSELARDNGAQPVNIKETKNASDFNQPVVAHSAIGKNNDPLSKINDFKAVMESGVGDVVDIAFFKFCYVDITRDTDIDKVFTRYAETMVYLEGKYPSVTFVYSTVPLRVSSSGAKTAIKKMLGRTSSDEEDNIKRNRLNQILAERYGRGGRLFDLARYEAARIGGGDIFFESNGKKYYSLNPEYTDDGKHLNALGAKIIGTELLRFLSSL